MADEFKILRDTIFRTLLGGLEDPSETAEADFEEGERSRLDYSTTKALLTQVFAKAGKSKDEVVQIVAREIGTAVAHMLKEPLAQLAKNQKLQISFEFVPKSGSPEAAETPTEAPQKTTAASHQSHHGESHGRRKAARVAPKKP